MSAFFVATGVLLLLWCEGSLLSFALLTGRTSGFMHISLGLPFAACINVVLIFGLTLLSLPLTPLTILAPHGALLLVFLLYRRARSDSPIVQSIQGIRLPRLMQIFCGIILTGTILYSIVHAFVLPTFHYDSATNWNMRAKASFYEQQMIIEEQYSFIRKPHYPILFHAWQITAHQGQSAWREPIANGSHWLLSFTSFFALFLFLRFLRGPGVALLGVTATVGMPLMTLHLGQSYADATLVQFALLSLTSLLLYQREQDGVWLIVSGVFCAACVWTKTEGIAFCLLPWLVMTGVLWLYASERRKSVLVIGSAGLVFSAIWPVYVLARGLSLTPHSGADTAITWNPSAVPAVLDALFVQGSFGVHWYALVIAFAAILMTGRNIFPLLWGLFACFGYLAVYLFTTNAQYLLSGQAFDRQMLLPAALLTVGCVYALTGPLLRPARQQSAMPALRHLHPDGRSQ